MTTQLSESKASKMSPSLRPVGETSDEVIYFPLLKSYLSKTILELKEELTLDFNDRIATLSVQVTALRDEVAYLRKDAEVSYIKIKSDLMTDLNDQEKRKCNLMIFGAHEAESSDSSDIREKDEIFLKNLASTLGELDCKFKSHFRLGAARKNGTRTRIVPEDESNTD